MTHLDSSRELSYKNRVSVSRDSIQSSKPPKIDHAEIKTPKKPRKKQDTFETLKRDTLKSFGGGDFADKQWSVIESFILSAPERSSRRVTTAQKSSFGTIEDLFSLITKEVNSEVGDWEAAEDESE